MSKVEMTVDNIVEVVQSNDLVSEELAKQALKELSDKENESKKEDLKQRLITSSYERAKSLLRTRSSREIAKHDKEHLSAITTLDEKLQSGRISVQDYDKEKKKADEARAKAVREEQEALNDLIDQAYSNAQRSTSRWFNR